MIKYEYKRDVNSTIENRLNDLGGKGWELVLLIPIPLDSLDALFTGYFKRILKPNTVGIVSRCRC
jgi:hypothetical protein